MSEKVSFRKFSVPVQLRKGGGNGGSILLTIPKRLAMEHELDRVAESNEFVLLTIEPYRVTESPEERPPLEHMNVYEDHITIRDNRIGRYIDIYPKDGEMWCEFCEGKNCEHIRFALTIPEVEKVLKKRGWI